MAECNYDANGMRAVRKVGAMNGQEVKQYVYGTGGQLLTEYGGTVTTGTRYLVADHMGSTRMVVDDTARVRLRRWLSRILIHRTGCKFRTRIMMRLGTRRRWADTRLCRMRRTGW